MQFFSHMTSIFKFQARLKRSHSMMSAWLFIWWIFYSLCKHIVVPIIWMWIVAIDCRIQIRNELHDQYIYRTSNFFGHVYWLWLLLSSDNSLLWNICWSEGCCYLGDYCYFYTVFAILHHRFIFPLDLYKV